MDYLHPIEALIPGARGQVLAALTRDISSRTIRQLSLDAGVSWSRTSEVVEDLVELGLVQRRSTPGAVLVHLVEENLVVQRLQEMSDLRAACIDGLRRAAKKIRPAPLGLVVFGSFARGTARRNSDIDAVAVRAESVAETKSWSETMGRWAVEAAAITGNPVNLIEVAADELTSTAGRPRAWVRDASEQGIVILGRPLQELIAASPARSARG